MIRPTPVASEPSVTYLLGWLSAIEDRVRRTVAARRAVDPVPDDPFRGLYVNDAQVDWLLGAGSDPFYGLPELDMAVVSEVEEAADRAESTGVVVRLRRMRTI